METKLLGNPDEFPTDKVLARALGKAKSAWDAFTAAVAERFPEASLEWRYYNDGKSWLGKMTRKKKTVCWISVWDGFFQTTCYFMERDAPAIRKLDIAASLKEAFASSAGTGKLKPLTIKVRTPGVLPSVYRVFEYKIGSPAS